MQSMIVLGETYQGCELIRRNSRQVIGVRTTSKEFHFVNPLFDEQGNRHPEIPLFLPAEMRAITHEPPDLTAEHSNTVKATWRKAPRKLRAVSLRQYSLSAHAREAVWKAHGTDELASIAGYIWHWPEDSTKASVAQTLAWRIAQHRSGPDLDAAYDLIHRARFVVIYHDEPEFSRVFLEGLHACERPSKQLIRPSSTLPATVSRQEFEDKTQNIVAPILAWLDAFDRTEGERHALNMAAHSSTRILIASTHEQQAAEISKLKRKINIHSRSKNARRDGSDNSLVFQFKERFTRILEGSAEVLTLRRSPTAQLLRELYENCSKKNVPVDWEAMSKKIGTSERDPNRFLQGRRDAGQKRTRSNVLRGQVLTRIVDVVKRPGATITYTVRLNPSFRYRSDS